MICNIEAIDLIRLEIIENNLGGHSDLLFEIEGLTDVLKFDSYYFALELEKQNITSLNSGLIIMLENWIQKMDNLKTSDSLLFPIDISDEYMGCLRIRKFQKLTIEFGVVQIEGWSINPINPPEFSDADIEFQNDSKKKIEIEMVDLQNYLISLINKLRKTNVA